MNKAEKERKKLIDFLEWYWRTPYGEDKPRASHHYVDKYFEEKGK